MAINFPRAEEDVLALWEQLDAFQTQLRLTEGGKPYVFYDGPPFATGKIAIFENQFSYCHSI